MRPIRYVYVAGPYTGDVEGNCRRAIAAAERLATAGFVPFVPHLYRAWDAYHPHGYEHWMALCLATVERQDALVLLAESPGALREAEFARQRGMPVLGLDEILRQRPVIAIEGA